MSCQWLTFNASLMYKAFCFHDCNSSVAGLTLILLKDLVYILIVKPSAFGMAKWTRGWLSPLLLDWQGVGCGTKAEISNASYCPRLLFFADAWLQCEHENSARQRMLALNLRVGHLNQAGDLGWLKGIERLLCCEKLLSCNFTSKNCLLDATCFLLKLRCFEGFANVFQVLARIRRARCGG